MSQEQTPNSKPQTPNYSIILFDGICNFCNGMVNFAIRHDKKDQLRFAALQSEAGQKLLAAYNLTQEKFDSFILIENGKVYQKSSAALRVFKAFPWYWQVFQVLRIIPNFICNPVYDFIARNRYKWFGKKEQCMIPTPELRSKFL